jgi:hypothetical protein
MPRLIVWPLQQVSSFPDTIIARTIPDRGVLEWTNGILEMLVLLLAAGALAALIVLLLAVRDAVRKAHTTLDTLTKDTQPLLANANAIVRDARDMVATVKRDVTVVSDAAAAMGDTLLDAAEITAQRVDDVNAVLDVIQDELEETAITAVSAIRGARLGTQAMFSHLPRRKMKRRRPDASESSDADDRAPGD